MIGKLAVLGLGSAMLASGAAAESIKVATWNMNNLHHVLGEPLRDRAPARSEKDYEILRKYRDRLGADVIALQEVNGPKAARLVFAADEYDLYFSARYIDDLVTGKATHPDPLEPYDTRVDRAMRRILAGQRWTDPQRRWLERIANQIKQEVVVDREALDAGQFRQEGGFRRLNRVFEGRLETVLGEINEAIWAETG